MAKDHRRLNAELAQEVLLDDPGVLRQIVERVLQEMLEAEMTEHIGAAPYERSAARAGHRNGHERRALRTRVGTLNLLVPQDREGAFSTGPSPATSATRRRPFWRLWRCTWRASLPRRSRK